jgi:hypothetical protein
MENKEQDSNEVLDYYQDISNDTISSVAWTISPTGPTLGTAYLPNTTTRAYKRLSGPFSATHYLLTAKVTCSSGQVVERTCNVIITHKP